MADEVERELTEDDVEGQQLNQTVGRVRSGRVEENAGPGGDQIRLAKDDQDVEGQIFKQRAS